MYDCAFSKCSELGDTHLLIQSNYFLCNGHLKSDALYLFSNQIQLILSLSYQIYKNHFYKYIKKTIILRSYFYFLKLIFIFIIMKSVIRKLVAGPKKKTPFNGQQLDLTYITDRIIAMAYPASNFFQKAYRNSIDDVANYFNQYHKDNYLIINISCRPYDYSKFSGRVRQYEWADHQAPPITTLVQIAYQIKQFLEKNDSGVVAVHCNHGKGRTGTAIIGFMLYMSLFKKASQALTFYNSQRFSSNEYGVDQPCQTRYLNFLERLIDYPKIPRKLIGYRLVTVSQTGLHDKYYLTIKKARNNESLLNRFNFAQHSKLVQKPLIGDIFIQIYEDVWSGPKKLARINYHTFFLNPKFELNIKQIIVKFQSDQIKCNKVNDKPFFIKMQFQFYCLCHIEGSEGIECECTSQRVKQQQYWNRMIDELQKVKKLKENEKRKYFYCQAVEIQKQQKMQLIEQKAQKIYKLPMSMSNIFQQKLQLSEKFKYDDMKQQKIITEQRNVQNNKTSSSSEDV